MVGFIRKSHLAQWLAAACLGAVLLVGCEQRDGTTGYEQGEPSEPMGQASPEQRQRMQDQSGYEQAEPSSPLGRAQAQEAPEAEQPVPFEQEEQARVEEPPYQRPEVEDREMQQAPPVEPGQQQAQQQQPQAQQPQAQQQVPHTHGEMPGASDEASLIRGTVEGTARSIDLARGTVTIESGGQEVTLQAHPSDLARIDAGETVSLDFTSYPDGSQWLEPTADASDVLEQSDSVGQLQGQIEAIDEDAGIVAVGGQTLRAHPDQLEALEPGESVSVSYAEVEDTPWVAEVEPGQQDRVAQTEPQQPLDEEDTASDIDWEFIN